MKLLYHSTRAIERIWGRPALRSNFSTFLEGHKPELLRERPGWVCKSCSPPMIHHHHHHHHHPIHVYQRFAGKVFFINILIPASNVCLEAPPASKAGNSQSWVEKSKVSSDKSNMSKSQNMLLEMCFFLVGCGDLFSF